MDPIGAALTLALAASAFYRTIAGKRDPITVGLWVAAFAFVIAALVVPLGTALKSITGLDGLSQSVSLSAFVVSSYLIARMTYHVAGIDSRWPIIFTVTSITGIIALYCGTELHHTQAIAIESVPGAASAWLAIVVAVGLLPTHISAIIGVMKIRHKENLLMWLLVIYGGVGALYPILITVNHIGTTTLRLPLSFVYRFNWFVSLISLGALALAGAIGAYRTRQECRVLVGAPGAF